MSLNARLFKLEEEENNGLEEDFRNLKIDWIGFMWNLVGLRRKEGIEEDGGGLRRFISIFISSSFHEGEMFLLVKIEGDGNERVASLFLKVFDDVLQFLLILWLWILFILFWITLVNKNIV